MQRLTPSGDNRDRATKTTKLWVISIKDHNDKVIYHIVDGIERSICVLKGREGCCVRYDGYIYPLHSPKRLKRVIRKVKNGKALMWHFMGPGHEIPESLDSIKRLPFIIEGEEMGAY